MPSLQYSSLKILAKLFQILPESLAAGLGAFCGRVMYLCDSKHRDLVYQNLKTAFCSEKSLPEIRSLTRRFFINLGVNFSEFLRLPLLNPADLSARVRFNGIDHFHQAMAQGKGAVLMTIHYGNWELPMLAFSSFGYPENLIYKAQSSASGFNEFMLASRLNTYQKFHSMKLFERGMGARTLFKALGNQEIIGMLIDQGGKDGVPVRFFGRRARFSSGGVRLAMRTGAAVCIGGLARRDGLTHELMIHPFLPAAAYEDDERNIQLNLQRAADVFEEMIRNHPEQYMWMYKIWKGDPSRSVMILDDGRVGHLRQSQSVAKAVRGEVISRGGDYQEKSVRICYRHPAAQYLMLLCGLLGPVISKRCALWVVQFCLTAESFEGLCAMKADVVISAGSVCGPVNALVSREHQAKSVTLLRPGAVPLSRFDAVILPEHDTPLKPAAAENIILTKGAPNLVDEQYLAEQAALLMRRYSHLKLRHKLVIGVLLGGDTKSYVLDESVARILAHQIKDAAEQLDADILVTTSRRTSEKVENILTREFKKYERCRLLVIANRVNVIEAVGGILGLAHVVVVSGDSISMVSEAASSGKRTVVFPFKRRQGSRDDYKHNRFVDRMNKEGYVLSSEPRMISQSILHLVKNKITTRKLDDALVVREGIGRVL